MRVAHVTMLPVALLLATPPLRAPASRRLLPRACVDGMPKTFFDALAPTDSPPSPPAPAEVDDGDDPIYRDELWLDSKQVRYVDGAHGAGVGYCVSYSPSTRAGNHSRAVLILDTPARAEDEEALFALAGRVALSCECVALVPMLRGGRASWPPERLANEAWAATGYLNAAYGAEALAIVAVGATVPTTLMLLGEGVLDAHACVAICPDGEPAAAARVARELTVPLLAVCDGGAGGVAQAGALRDALALNSRLRSDYYVAAFADTSASFVLTPQDAADAGSAERALALLQGWCDRFLPVGLQSKAK